MINDILPTTTTRITIENVNANAAIAGFDIKKILESISHAQYRPNKFPALGVNVGTSKIWLYDSGKVTSAGSKSIDDAIDSINYFVRMLGTLGMNITVTSKPHITNIVVTVIPSKRIDISKIKDMIEFIKVVPTFGYVLLSFENGTSVRIYQNGTIGASNGTLSKIIHTLKVLEEYQMD